jgi:hypothetical protein
MKRNATGRALALSGSSDLESARRLTVRKNITMVLGGKGYHLSRSDQSLQALNNDYLGNTSFTGALVETFLLNVIEMLIYLHFGLVIRTTTMTFTHTAPVGWHLNFFSKIGTQLGGFGGL